MNLPYPFGTDISTLDPTRGYPYLAPQHVPDPEPLPAPLQLPGRTPQTTDLTAWPAGQAYAISGKTGKESTFTLQAGAR